MWIPHGLVRVHFDATRDDVVVPKYLRTTVNLVFEWGHDMPKSISDMKIDHEAISGTLSFGPYGWIYCFVPWAAVFCVTSPALNAVGLWINDAPGEVQRDMLRSAGEKANEKLRRERFTVIKGGG